MTSRVRGGEAAARTAVESREMEYPELAAWAERVLRKHYMRRAAERAVATSEGQG